MGSALEALELWLLAPLATVRRLAGSEPQQAGRVLLLYVGHVAGHTPTMMMQQRRSAAPNSAQVRAPAARSLPRHRRTTILPPRDHPRAPRRAAPAPALMPRAQICADALPARRDRDEVRAGEAQRRVDPAGASARAPGPAAHGGQVRGVRAPRPSLPRPPSPLDHGASCGRPGTSRSSSRRRRRTRSSSARWPRWGRRWTTRRRRRRR